MRHAYFFAENSQIRHALTSDSEPVTRDFFLRNLLITDQHFSYLDESQYFFFSSAGTHHHHHRLDVKSPTRHSRFVDKDSHAQLWRDATADFFP